MFQSESGYVQGMGYITAVLLMYMNEEDAFWTMVSILTKYDQAKYFLPSMPGLWETFYVLQNLMKDKLPRMNEHLKKLNLCPSMYATQWFITICTVGFKYECTLRIFDAFFAEGPKILFRIALHILKENHDHIILGGMEELFAILRIYLK